MVYVIKLFNVYICADDTNMFAVILAYHGVVLLLEFLQTNYITLITLKLLVIFNYSGSNAISRVSETNYIGVITDDNHTLHNRKKEVSRES